MKQRKRNNLIFYVFYTLVFLVSGAGMWCVIRKGEALQMAEHVATSLSAPRSLHEGFRVFGEQIAEHVGSSFGLLMLQIIVILITCRIVGGLFNKLRQPTVIGEILAGILLGPSILGYFLPDASAFLFPPESLSSINMLSQFGLILFMFTIGMELDMGEVRRNFRASLLISHTSMVVPFALGVGMAYFIYEKYAYPETSFLAFALFIGIAMSITAFPVLARIIQERKLTRTRLGIITLASAANGDITAWCILAVVVAITQAGGMLSAFYNMLFSMIYMAVMFFIVRPLMQMIGNLYHNKEVVDKPFIMLMFLLLLLSSYLTEMLGLHALFGAFMAGIVMPNNLRFRKLMSDKVEDVALALFLPLFFASTGLRTEIGLLDTSHLWWLCGACIAVAIAGKFGGTLLAARVAGENWKNSLFLGGLMNTRGLMELVVLAIGYEMRILPPPVFVILILMTLVTTFMTMPLLSFIAVCFRAGERRIQLRRERQKKNVFRVLLAFGRASSGQVMLDVAHQMFAGSESRLDLTALHLTPGPDVNPHRADRIRQVSFSSIMYEAKKLNMRIQMRHDLSPTIKHDVVDIVNREGYDFLLVGAGIAMSNQTNDVEARNIFGAFSRVFRIFRFIRGFTVPEFAPGSLLKDKTKWFVEHSHCTVGVFVNRDFISATQILLIIQSADDLSLLDYAKTLVKSSKGKVSVLNRSSFVSSENERIHTAIDTFVKHTEDALILPEKDVMNESFSGHNFMLVGYATWNILLVECKEALKDMPSTLIIRHREKAQKKFEAR